MLVDERNIPECEREGCHNNAFIYHGGKWYCGECISKLHFKKEKIQREEMERLDDG